MCWALKTRSQWTVKAKTGSQNVGLEKVDSVKNSHFWYPCQISGDVHGSSRSESLLFLGLWGMNTGSQVLSTVGTLEKKHFTNLPGG